MNRKRGPSGRLPPARGRQPPAAPEEHPPAGQHAPAADAVERRARDLAANRALFEEALKQIDSAGSDELAAELADKLRRGEAEGARRAENPGRSARFAKRVARGEVEPAAVLDLHRLDRETAADRLRRFLAAARGEVVLVVHGRGLGILEAVAIGELDRHSRVAEHLPAPKRWGGAGARMVRLRVGSGKHG